MTPEGAGAAMSDPVDLLALLESTGSERVTSASDGWAWRLARCWAGLDRLARGAGDRAVHDAVLADLRALPVGFPGRPRVAALLALAGHRLVAGDHDGAMLDGYGELVRIADEDPEPPPWWPAPRAAMRAVQVTRLLQTGSEAVDLRAVRDELAGLAAVTSGHPPYDVPVAAARDLVDMLLRQEGGEVPAGQGTPHVDEVVDAEPESPLDVRRQIMNLMVRAQEELARGDVAGAIGSFDRVGALADRLPPGDMLREAYRSAMVTLDAMRPGARPPGPGPAAVTDPLAALRRRVAEPGRTPSERAGDWVELAGAAQALAESGQRPDLLDEAVQAFREGVALVPEHDRNANHYRVLLAGALVRAHQVRAANGIRDRATADEALAVVAGARERLGGPDHPLWSLLCSVAADAERAVGRTAAALAVGLDALRGHQRAVLLQPGAGGATAAARHAAGDAVDVARAHLAADDPGGAAVALDAGRGLLLRAALRFRDAAAQLRHDGDHALADRWERAVEEGVEQAPAELRRAVLARLLGAAPGGRAAELDPPDRHQVRAALLRSGADAFVYLVPGSGPGADVAGPGFAVVLRADAEPTRLRLPGLDPASAELLRFTGAGPAGPRGPSDPEAPGGHRGVRTERSGSVREIGEWAWTVAVGPLLAHLGPGADGPRRVVLVPMGELAAVPWHAASVPGPDGRRFAIEEAVFSYAVSARLYCDLAWSPDVPADGDGLVLADPDTAHAAPDLFRARVEALAVRSAFYPAARCLGRPDRPGAVVDGPGTVEQVRDWLGTGTGAVLHAACHGVAEPGRGDGPTSGLLLAGGQRLAAEDLVAALARRRAREPGLVVLAACSTAASTRGYDEAFSIGTAFLASGARAVVSALWDVPDTATSALMYLFHHFLRTRPPVDALRAAQLGILREDPEALAVLPRSLRRGASGADETGWAGFVHAGR